MHPVITIFCPFTRRWSIDRWLENLAAVEHDPALTHICVIIDGDEPYIYNMLKKFTEARGYRSFHVKTNPQWHPNEVNLKLRRHRVAEIHNQSKDLIAKTDGDIVIGLEDDTVFDRMPSFERLIAPLNTIQRGVRIGFVEGVQMGRHGARLIGAWQADDIRNPKHIQTLLPSQGYQEITGGGWYGYATLKTLYLDHEYYTSTNQPWGPDVNYGFYVRQQGYGCLIDWETMFGHNDFNTTMYADDPKARLAQVVFTKNPETGRWDRKDYERR